MNTTIYIRTSTEEQNPYNQLDNIKSTLPEGISYRILQDKQSAFKDTVDRKSWSIIINDIKKGLISDLYVWDWDRIYRNRIKLKDFFSICKMYKVKVHSYRQSWYEDLNKIPSPFNDIMIDLMLNLMGWLAEDESIKKSDRIKASIRKRKGKTVSYKGNRWGRKPLPKQTRDNIIELYNKGLSIRKIAELVKTTDSNHNMKSISKSVVHKTIALFKQSNNSISECP